MRHYELVLVVKPSVSDSDRKKLLETVKGLIKDVKVAEEEDWGQKPLAYPIKHEVAGVYYKWNLEAETSIPVEFEHTLIKNDKILRHLLVRTK